VIHCLRPETGAGIVGRLWKSRSGVDVSAGMRRLGLMLYSCDMCGANVEFDSTKKLLNKRYCPACISKARSDRREQVFNNPTAMKRRALAKKKKEGDTRLQKRISDAKIYSLVSISGELLSNGPKSLLIDNIPIRLKRNERVYFLAGRKFRRTYSVALALTNQRFFFVNVDKPILGIGGATGNLSITQGIKAYSLSNVIAIDVPRTDRDYSSWTSTIHLDRGTDISVSFEECRAARSFYVLLAEMVDRINDPIDESVFSPKRERISEDVKVAIWRRDRGSCVRCGSRENLEYDHIIPVSKGGSNTVRNIELLCESCNRRKSNRIM